METIAGSHLDIGCPLYGTHLELSDIPYTHLGDGFAMPFAGSLIGTSHLRVPVQKDYFEGTRSTNIVDVRTVKGFAPEQIVYSPYTDFKTYSWSIGELISLLGGRGNTERSNDNNVFHLTVSGVVRPLFTRLYHHSGHNVMDLYLFTTRTPVYDEAYSAPGFGNACNQLPVFGLTGPDGTDPDSWSVVGVNGSPIDLHTGQAHFDAVWADKDRPYQDLPECTSPYKVVSYDGHHFIRDFLMIGNVLSYTIFTYNASYHWLRRIKIRHHIGVDLSVTTRENTGSILSTAYGSYEMQTSLYISHLASGHVGVQTDIPGWFHYPEYDDLRSVRKEYAHRAFPLTAYSSPKAVNLSQKTISRKNSILSVAKQRALVDLVKLRPAIHFAVADAMEKTRSIHGNLVETSLKMSSVIGFLPTEEWQNVAKYATQDTKESFDIYQFTDGVPTGVSKGYGVALKSIEDLGGYLGVLRNLTRLVSAMYIAYRFGWRPTSSSLEDAIKTGSIGTIINDGVIALGSLLKPTVVHGSSTLTKEDHANLPCATLTVKTRFTIHPNSELAAAIIGLDKISILPKPSLAWGAIPFSWAIDWAINAQGRLSRIEDYVFMALYGASDFCHSYKWTYPIKASELASLGLENAGPEPAFITVYVREKSLYIPAVGFRTGMPDYIEPHHPDVWIVLSLLLQFFL